MKIFLPLKKDIIVTNEEDPVNYYYVPFINSLYISRFVKGLQLIGDTKREKVLDIGYGSGILFLELNKRFNELYGLDIHDKKNEVYNMLKKYSINAELTQGSVLNLPYSDNEFDCVVMISILEHIKEVNIAIKEIRRVLKKNGIAVMGIPSTNMLMNLLFKFIGCLNINKYHVTSQRKVLRETEKEFQVEKIVYLPYSFVNLYMLIKCRK